MVWWEATYSLRCSGLAAAPQAEQTMACSFEFKRFAVQRFGGFSTTDSNRHKSPPFLQRAWERASTSGIPVTKPPTLAFHGIACVLGMESLTAAFFRPWVEAGLLMSQCRGLP
jgi:hypothetical protein